MSAKHDPSIPANISMKRRTLKIIDTHKVEQGPYKSRSDYMQDLADRDLDYGRFEFITELMSMNVVPMMGFIVFCLVALLTKGTLFYMFAAIFGILAVWLSIMYYKKHGRRNRIR